MLVARPTLSWPQIMEFVVAVRPRARVTAMTSGKDVTSRGRAGHFVVGDERGTVTVFGMDGGMLLEHQTQEVSAITALAEIRNR